MYFFAHRFIGRRIITTLAVCVMVFGACFCMSPASVSGVYAAADATNQPEVRSPAAILVDSDNGEIVFEKGENTPREPMGLVRVMVALIASETYSPDDILTMDLEVYNAKGREIFLQNGEEIPMESLMYAMLLYGAEDAALGFAKNISETVEDFVSLMNSRAKALGCTGTNFVNPTGRSAEGQVSTAHDLALIIQAAAKADLFRTYVSKAEYTVPATKWFFDRPLKNPFLLVESESPEDPEEGLDEILGIVGKPLLRYEGTIVAGSENKDRKSACIIATEERDGKNYLAVVFTDNLGTGAEYADAIALLDYGFNRTKEIEIFVELSANGTTVNPGYAGLPETLRIGASGVQTLEVELEQAEAWESQDMESSYEYTFNEGLAPPLSKGDIVGVIIAKLGDEIIGESDMVLLEEIEAPKGFWETVGFTGFQAEGFSFYLKAGAVIIVLLVIILLIVLIRHRYTRDPYVRSVRSGRASKEIRRVRKLK